MILILLTIVQEPASLLTNMAPLIYSIMGILGFVVLGKSIYRGDSVKTIIGKILIITVICYMVLLLMLLLE